MSDEFPVLDELERRLIAGCYPDGRHSRAGERRPWRWTRPGWAAASISAIALAATVIVAVLLASGGVAPSAAARALGDAARASETGAAPVLAPGEYWYTRTISSSIEPIPLPPRVIAPGTNPPAVIIAVMVRQSLETWIGRDGTIRQRQSTLSERLANAVARRRLRASGESLPHFGSTDSVSVGDGWFPPQGAGLGDIGDGLFSYRQLLALPTSVPALRARLEQAQAALTRREQHGLSTQVQSGAGVGTMQIVGHAPEPVRDATSLQDLTTITSLLTTPVPSAVRAALYRVAASLPGVTYDGQATDALGRAGVAISIGTATHGMRMIFDPSTGALLQTTMLVSGSLQGVKPEITQTIAGQGVAGSLNSLPEGVRPIGHMERGPETIAISPRAGTPSTTFHLAVQSARTVSRSPAPTLTALIFGPTAPGCHAYLLPPPVARFAHGAAIHAGGHVAYGYALPARAIGRTAWCPGRYQLQILTNNQTSIYFEVR